MLFFDLALLHICLVVALSGPENTVRWRCSSLQNQLSDHKSLPWFWTCKCTLSGIYL